MPQLARRAAPLLRRVQGKQHATDENHEEGASRPRKSRKLDVEEDVFREPESSSENEDGAPTSQSQISPEEKAEQPGINNAKISAQPAKATKRSAKARSTKATTTENGHENYVTGKGSGPVVDLDDDKMASWSSRPAARKNKKSFGKNSSADAATTSSKFHRPLGLPDNLDTFKSKSKFKPPSSQPEAHSQLSSSPPSQFKMPIAMPALDQTDTAVRPLRRSRRQAGEADTVSTDGSSFKHTPTLAGLDISPGGSPSSRFMDRQLTGTVHSDPMSQSSQSDADQLQQFFAEDLEDDQLQGAKVISCPYCHSPVTNPKLVDSLSGKKQMSVRQQAVFCQSHRRDEARQRWREQQYPEIEWDLLPVRVARLSSCLAEIINDQRPSVFRERLSLKIASGKYRSLYQTLNNDAKAIDSWTPGYYGGRGAKVISSLLIDTFSKQIRERAGQDKLIGASGVSGFVQAVLVPEAATRLISDDMGVDDRRALEVLEESTEVGDLLFDGEDEEGGMSFTQI